MPSRWMCEFTDARKFQSQRNIKDHSVQFYFTNEETKGLGRLNNLFKVTQNFIPYYTEN